MNRKFSIAIVLVAVIMAFTACASKPAQNSGGIKYIKELNAEYPERSLEELVSNSNLVVRAKKTGELPSVERDQIIVTDSTFDILEVFKGDKKVGEEIKVQTLGGIIGDTKQEIVGQRTIEKGEEVLLVLEYPTDADHKISSKDYYVFHPLSGIFYKNQNADADGNHAEYISFDKRYTYRTSAFQEEINRIVKRPTEK